LRLDSGDARRGSDNLRLGSHEYSEIFEKKLKKAKSLLGFKKAQEL